MRAFASNVEPVSEGCAIPRSTAACSRTGRPESRSFSSWTLPRFRVARSTSRIGSDLLPPLREPFGQGGLEQGRIRPERVAQVEVARQRLDLFPLHQDT